MSPIFFRKRLTFFAAVQFLESMGLPKTHLTATRKQVEGGKLSFKDSIQYKMYSRHDQPADELESDSRNGELAAPAKS